MGVAQPPRNARVYPRQLCREESYETAKDACIGAYGLVRSTFEIMTRTKVQDTNTSPTTAVF